MLSAALNCRQHRQKKSGQKLPYEADGDARRLAQGCKVLDFGLAQGVPGKAPIFYALKVSFRVPQRKTELREEKQKLSFLLTFVFR